MIYLYVKTHNKTGLKYLGKTEQNPQTYKGSGKYWINHINKHGYDVTTEVIGTFQTNEELSTVSKELSEKWRVVDSSEWANLRPESGDGGDTSKHIDYSSLERGKGKTYEQRYGKEKAIELKKSRANVLTETRKGKTWDEIFGEEMATELRQKAADRVRKYHIGAKRSEETKRKISESAKGRKHPKSCCIVCGKEVASNNLSKHHQTHQSDKSD